MITKYFSQKDKRWAKLKLGSSKLEMKDFGCLVASLSMIIGMPPDLTLQILNKSNCFTKEGALICPTAAKVLGYTYQKIGYLQSETKISFPCIGETDHFTKMNYRQHFFVCLKDGRRIDPLDINPKPEPNDYHIVSFRVFLKKQV